MKKTLLYPLLALALLVAAQLACGGEENTGRKIDEVGIAEVVTKAPPKLKLFKVGDVIQVQNHTIVLNSVSFGGSMLQANFTIENQGSDEVIVSSMLDFSARGPDGTKLELAIFDCDSSLTGTVLAGDKIRGDLCWKCTEPSAKIYYEASLFGSGAVVWEVSK